MSEEQTMKEYIDYLLQKFHTCDILENQDFEDLNNGKIIKVNYDQLCDLLDGVMIHYHNTLCVQIDNEGNYWIRFDDGRIE